MITTRKNFAKQVGLSYIMVTILFDRFHIKIAKQAYLKQFEITKDDLKNFRNFLAEKNGRRKRDYTKPIELIDKIIEHYN